MSGSNSHGTFHASRVTANVICAQETLVAVRDGRALHGAVIATAEMAGKVAATRTAELCHPLALSRMDVTVEPDDDIPGFRITAEAETTSLTGVEMEALTAASITCMALYDMLKAIDDGIRVADLRVVSTCGKPAGWT